MKIDKYYLNLAGEYRVCAELLKRGIFATVTFGNMKGADVIAFGVNRRTAVIEVKASNSTRFVTKLYQKYKTPDGEHPTFWILYSVRSDGKSHKEHFFILTHEESAAKQAQRNCRDEKLSYLECVRRFDSGVDNVLHTDVEEFEDQWDKVVKWCSSAE
ncbi:MAG TPA: hypothetical protein VFC78_09985 [Tepidisphaeraceae bacterium]|nr:hypothetical protein [Tepidisphaeraceae bacterium]